MLNFNILCFCACLIFINIVQLVESDSLTASDELLLASEQKKKFKEFKNEVANMLISEYFRTDIMLVKIFRASDMDVAKAVQRVKDISKFRIDENIEGILDQTFPYFDKYDLFHTAKEDKKGRAVLVLILGEFNVFQQITSGQGQQMSSFVYQQLESFASKTIQKHESMAKHKISRYNVIIDVSGIDVLIATCAECIAWLKKTGGNQDSQWPSMYYRFIIINTPSFFEAAIATVKGILSKDSQEALVVFGTDSTKWMEYLEDLVGEGNVIKKLKKSKSPGVSGGAIPNMNMGNGFSFKV